jgi:hypothetical protein
VEAGQNLDFKIFDRRGTAFDRERFGRCNSQLILLGGRKERQEQRE